MLRCQALYLGQSYFYISIVSKYGTKLEWRGYRILRGPNEQGHERMVEVLRRGYAARQPAPFKIIA